MILGGACHPSNDCLSSILCKSSARLTLSCTYCLKHTCQRVMSVQILPSCKIPKWCIDFSETWWWIDSSCILPTATVYLIKQRQGNMIYWDEYQPGRNDCLLQCARLNVQISQNLILWRLRPVLTCTIVAPADRINCWLTVSHVTGRVLLSWSRFVRRPNSLRLAPSHFYSCSF